METGGNPAIFVHDLSPRQLQDGLHIHRIAGFACCGPREFLEWYSGYLVRPEPRLGPIDAFCADCDPRVRRPLEESGLCRLAPFGASPGM